MNGPADAAQFELGEQTRAAFLCGLTVEEAIVDLTLPAMGLGIDVDEAARLIHEFFETCAKRETPNDAIARCALMGPVQYDRVRKDVAKQHRVRPATLDAEVAKLQKQHQAQRPSAKEPPQWSPAAEVWDTPIAGAALLTELIEAIRRFVLLDQNTALIVALWILFTWVFEHVAETNPYLRIVSPTPECGKSTLLKVIKRLGRGGWLVAKITASSFTRTMERERRSLLLDEGDAFLHENEIMRNVLDAASDPDTATTSLSVKSGDDWIPTEFNVFVPIAIASIGMLRKMQTVESRSIHVRLKRATEMELKQLAKGRRRELKALLDPLAAKCARWAADNAEALKGALPEFPDGMSGRDMDKWEPLITIADAIGHETGDAARLEAAAASGAHDADTAPLGVALLADIRGLFDEKATDRFSSKTLSESLAEMEGRPWGEYGWAQKNITQNQLARLLKPFVIAPHSIRLADGTTPKGYERKDFADAFDRYLVDPKNADSPKGDDSNRHNATTQRGVRENADFQTATEGACCASKNGVSAHAEKDCGVVADEDGEIGAIRKNSPSEEDEIDRLARADTPPAAEEGLELYPDDDPTEKKERSS